MVVKGRAVCSSTYECLLAASSMSSFYTYLYAKFNKTDRAFPGLFSFIGGLFAIQLACVLGKRPMRVASFATVGSIHSITPSDPLRTTTAKIEQREPQLKVASDLSLPFDRSLCLPLDSPVITTEQIQLWSKKSIRDTYLVLTTYDQNKHNNGGLHIYRMQRPLLVVTVNRTKTSLIISQRRNDHVF